MSAHADLVTRAERWLRNTQRCGVVLVEMHSMAYEVPDVIGWNSHRSILVECKTTRGDFFADLKKRFRVHPEQGMGDFRYYMVPPGLLSPDEVPEHWGLLEARDTQVRVLKHSDRFPIDRTARRERPLLYSALRRLQEDGP